ncbi:hypothetical protein VIGAN_04324200 [Vigna angularis var. angularis]|uniref:GST N-terminal domain-containing protein n=1 Tax=Vigna angularis var. angularis TaxID=157739 RepID=A0A0S3RYL1_PHAAN|nr:hypothetical protein VIGAN_04324200 [Vigna angularis var. angularis]
MQFWTHFLSSPKLRKQTLQHIHGKCRRAKSSYSPPLTSTSKPPPLFDGTTRLYISYLCPYAQSVWITRDYKVIYYFKDYRTRSNWLPLIFQTGLPSIRRKSTQKTRYHHWSTMGWSWEKVSI